MPGERATAYAGADRLGTVVLGYPGADGSPLRVTMRDGCMTGPGLSTRAGVLCGGLVDDALEVVDRDRRRALPRDAQEPSGVGNDREALFGDLLDADPEVLGQCPLDRPELVHVETRQEGEVVPVAIRPAAHTGTR